MSKAMLVSHHFLFEHYSQGTEDLWKCFFESSILLETKKLLGLDFQFPSGKIVLFSSWSTGSGINHLKTVSQNTVERSVNLKAEARFLFEEYRVSRSFVNAPRHRCQSEAVTHSKWPDGGSLD